MAFIRPNSITKYLKKSILGAEYSKLFISFYNIEAIKYIDNIKFYIDTGLT